MYKKHVFISFLMIFIFLFSINITAFANKTIEQNTSVDYSSEIKLYDSNENVIAYYYELNPTGYVIVNADNNEMIEYSEYNNKYFSEKDAHYYYGGPLMYYKADMTRQVRRIIQLQSQKEVSIEDITPLMRGSEADVIGTLNIDNFLIRTRAVGSDSIPHSTARYSYNPDGRCGAVAGAIVLNYYDRYKSQSYVPSSLESSDGVSLINALVQRMGLGTNYTQLKNGLSLYLKQYYKPTTVTATTYSWGERVKKIIGKDYPCILGLTSHPKYGEHWVVVTGYNFTSNNTGTYTINDGWGNTGVYINSSYTDGCVDIG